MNLAEHPSRWPRLPKSVLVAFGRRLAGAIAILLPQGQNNRSGNDSDILIIMFKRQLYGVETKIFAVLHV